MADKEREQDWVSVSAQQGLETPTEFEGGLGITQEYNKINRDKYWDSAKRKAEHKEKTFGDKQTYKDPVSGKTLHKSQTAARKKYHMKNPEGENISKAWAKHSTNTDHIVSLKRLHKRTKDNPFLSDNDLKDIANRDVNYREISQHLNTEKGERSDYALALDLDADLPLSGRVELLKGMAKAEIAVNTEIALRTAKNAGKIFAEGAQNALASSAIPLVIIGSQSIVRIAKGEISPEEALNEFGKLGISIAASGGTMRTVTFAITETLQNSQNEIIKNFATANQIGSVLIIGSIIARATGKYINGEVDAPGFFKEITDSGLSLASGMLASKAAVALFGNGATIAPVLAAMIASAACSEICSYAKKMEEEKKANEEIRRIAADATIAIQQQQEELYRLLEEDHRQWAQQMTDIFQVIADGITNSDLDKTNEGLELLLGTYNCQVRLYGKDDSLTDDLLNARDNNEDFHII